MAYFEHRASPVLSPYILFLYDTLIFICFLRNSREPTGATVAYRCRPNYILIQINGVRLRPISSDHHLILLRNNLLLLNAYDLIEELLFRHGCSLVQPVLRLFLRHHLNVELILQNLVLLCRWPNVIFELLLLLNINLLDWLLNLNCTILGLLHLLLLFRYYLFRVLHQQLLDIIVVNVVFLGLAINTHRVKNHLL